MASETRSRVQTTETTFEIIDLLLNRDGVRINEIENELDLTTSTLYRHLTTLRENGYVLKEGETYQLSLKFLTIGGYLRRQLPGYSMIKAKVDDLATNTGERAQFMIRERTDRVYLYTETGENPVQTGAHTGIREPIHVSAAGKAIMSRLPKKDLENLIDSIQFEQTGPNAITDRDELKKELEEIEARGYALNLEESTRGVHAVGTAVQVNDEIIGALSVAGPATRMKKDRLESELSELVLSASNELGLQIQHMTSETPDNDL